MQVLDVFFFSSMDSENYLPSISPPTLKPASSGVKLRSYQAMPSFLMKISQPLQIRYQNLLLYAQAEESIPLQSILNQFQTNTFINDLFLILGNQWYAEETGSCQTKWRSRNLNGLQGPKVDYSNQERPDLPGSDSTAGKQAA